jgi:hypothetical protein
VTTNVPSPGTPTLGRLVPVALREVWAHEALDFTPWLLANADALGEALDMDLEITIAEHPVGGFSLDLIATDLRSNERVIIENQIETTDHAHLGQLLTYAGGTDPVNIVWIAAEFRDEHRAALDWLNQRTDADTRFFGVEVRAVRIGDSLPAPLFHVVAKPNDWGKSIRTQARSQEGSASEKNLLYATFWDRYLTRVTKEHPDWTRARKPPAQNWFPTRSGVSGVQFTVSFGRRGLQSELYFDHPDPTANIAMFEALHGLRDAIESAYGGTLSFEPLTDRKACRIADHRPGEITDSAAWPDYLDWFVDSQQRLRSAISAVGGIPKPSR